MANFFSQLIEFFSEFLNKFTWEYILQVILWSLIIIFFIIGFFGTFLPILPGTTLIYAGILLYYFFFGMEESSISWQHVVIQSLLYALSLVIDWVSGVVGAKWFGSSKWGVLGAISGGLVGLFFGLPGLILGPIFGVFLFEIIFARKKISDASNSTVGTLIGGTVGGVLRVAISGFMIFWFLRVFL